MTKIYYNSNEIKKIITTDLNNAISNLKLAVDYNANFTCPYEFKHKPYLATIASKLNNSLTELKKISKNINGSEQSFLSIENQLNDSIIDLENLNLTFKKSSIN